jgi:rare lipoprotein A (peptidoglycan hydrolase)
MTKMNKITLSIALLALFISYFMLTSTVRAEEEIGMAEETVETVQVPVTIVVQKTAPKLSQANVVKVWYKKSNKYKDVSGFSVFVRNKEVAHFISPVGIYTPETRAKILVARLKQFISQKGNPRDILPGVEKTIAIGSAKNQIIFTVDEEQAKKLSMAAPELAIKWVNNIRLALGGPPIVRHNILIASRGLWITPQALPGKNIKQQTGVASWYGGIFEGRRAADGSRFTRYNFTAAHKTLPFGSVVRVTNLRNSKSCLVRITDRGPFISGRIIDLSKAAAREINMVGTGVSKVKIEVLGKY